MKFLTFIMCFFLLTVSANAADKVFSAKTATLSNGMEIVLVENHRAPVVSHMVWYKVGAADEPWGKSGIAHFFEHMMFKGSENVPSGEFSTRVKALGGNDNAFTSQDYTAYFQNIAVEHLGEMMKMEADRMRGLLLPEEGILSERKVIMEERRERTDTNPQAQFAESLSAALWVNHPYGIPVIGWMHEIEALSAEDARAFYQQWYRPDNAIMVVSGDITLPELTALAEAHFGPVTNPETALPPRMRPQVPPLMGKVRLTMHDPVVRQPVFQRLYRVPNGNGNEGRVFEVLEEIMSGGPTTRLYQSLVVDQKLAVSVGMSYRGNAVDEGTLSLYASPAEKVEISLVENALEDELKKLVEEGITESELAEAKQRLKDGAVYARDSLSGPAMIIGQVLATGGKLEDLEYWPAAIDAVTAEDVLNVARGYLAEEGSKTAYVTGVLLPEPVDVPEAVNDNTAEGDAE